MSFSRATISGRLRNCFQVCYPAIRRLINFFILTNYCRTTGNIGQDDPEVLDAEKADNEQTTEPAVVHTLNVLSPSSSNVELGKRVKPVLSNKCVAPRKLILLIFTGSNVQFEAA